MRRRQRRWVAFFIMFAVGVAAGLVYGWVIRPARAAEVELSTLSIDYQTDAVLMTAECFRAEADPARALNRLAQLSDQPPLALLESALAFAREHNYAPADLQQMTELRDAIATLLPEGE
ncbi:hypothetical protein KQH50_00795 [bacterium]|nr:hypothetical protein [bacterium]